jgi:hypothetical protein
MIHIIEDQWESLELSRKASAIRRPGYSIIEF